MNLRIFIDNKVNQRTVDNLPLFESCPLITFLPIRQQQSPLLITRVLGIVVMEQKETTTEEKQKEQKQPSSADLKKSSHSLKSSIESKETDSERISSTGEVKIYFNNRKVRTILNILMTNIFCRAISLEKISILLFLGFENSLSMDSYSNLFPSPRRNHWLL